MCVVFFCSSLSLSLPPSSTSSQHRGVLITVLALNGFLLSHSNQGQTMTLIEVKRTYARAWEQRTCIRYKLKLLILWYKLFVTVAFSLSSNSLRFSKLEAVWNNFYRYHMTFTCLIFHISTYCIFSIRKLIFNFTQFALHFNLYLDISTCWNSWLTHSRQNTSCT